MRNRISYRQWHEEWVEFNNAIRPMTKQDVPECIAMTLESFGTKDYPTDQFNTIEEEFYASFDSDWWGRPKYFVFDYKGKIRGMGGYSLSPLDWGCYEFFWLCTRKGDEGHGVAKALVEHREKEVLKECLYKDDVTILFSCTKHLIKYHKKHGYKVLLKKAGDKEVIMGKTFLKNPPTPKTLITKLFHGLYNFLPKLI